MSTSSCLQFIASCANLNLPCLAKGRSKQTTRGSTRHVWRIETNNEGRSAPRQQRHSEARLQTEQDQIVGRACLLDGWLVVNLGLLAGFWLPKQGLLWRDIAVSSGGGSPIRACPEPAD